MFFESFVTVGTTKPEFEVADIFREFGTAYQLKYPTSQRQRKVIWNVSNCRTSVLGGYIEQCDKCKKFRINYCS
ncbi:MAG: hypothetical protein GY833_06670 [Aestuariibacter sp.]|nr:hypothetical protein [Aestuariibacter sp.]